MSVRQTSIDTYREVEQSGLLSRKRLEVFFYVANHPGCTAYDCEEFLHPRNRSTVNARFSELVRMNLIRELPGQEKIQHGHKRMTYELTGVINPLPLKNELSTGKKYGLMLAALCNIKAATISNSAGCPCCAQALRYAMTVLDEVS